MRDFSVNFNRVDLVYKTLSPTNLNISAAVLIPKSLAPDPAKTYPVIAHIHGGALITGTNPDPSFFARWIIDLATTTPAIIISPAYCLLPEVNGIDILNDISDFFTWLHSSFSSALLLAGLPQSPIPDLSRIAAIGESAGGYLCIQAGLLFNEHAKIKAVAAAYPAQYPDAETYNPRKEGDAEAERVVDEYLERVKNGEMRVRVSSPWPEKEELIMAMVRTGRHREMMGDHPWMKLEGALRHVAESPGREVPAMWILQGEGDEPVPKSAADDVVRCIREALPGLPLKYTVEPGPHLFDLECGIEEPWVKEGIDFLRQHWLEGRED